MCGEGLSLGRVYRSSSCCASGFGVWGCFIYNSPSASSPPHQSVSDSLNNSYIVHEIPVPECTSSVLDSARDTVSCLHRPESLQRAITGCSRHMADVAAAAKIQVLRMWLRMRMRGREERGLGLATTRKKAAKRREAAVLQFLALEDDEDVSRAFKSHVQRQRRVVTRAKEKWKGSSMYGYTMFHDGTTEELNDDLCYLSKFRMDRSTFASVAHDLELSACRFVPRSGVVAASKRTDLKPVRFKLGTCLYVLAMGCELPVAADVASVGKSTVEAWLDQFQEACLSPGST